MQQKDALTVLLTGRGEEAFADLIKRMANSKKLEFDLVVLKPEASPSGQYFKSTGDFKKEFLENLVFTYKVAEEIKIYEDRPRQCVRVLRLITYADIKKHENVPGILREVEQVSLVTSY